MPATTKKRPPAKPAAPAVPDALAVLAAHPAGWRVLAAMSDALMARCNELEGEAGRSADPAVWLACMSKLAAAFAVLADD